jgi:hypothetical protein
MARITRSNQMIFLTILLMTAFGVGVLYSAPSPSSSSNKAMTSFSIAGAAGVIDDHGGPDDSGAFHKDRCPRRELQNKWKSRQGRNQGSSE